MPVGLLSYAVAFWRSHFSCKVLLFQPWMTRPAVFDSFASQSESKWIMSFQETVNSRLTANRRLLVGVYAGLGLVSALVYLSQENVSLVAISGSRSGVGAIFIALPAILPYVLSGVYAWQLISEKRLGLYFFLAATVVGTVAANLVITGTFDVPMTAETAFWYALAQTGVYGMAAEFLLRIEWS
jgi:hypothetical protein